jgi:DNA-binding IclR family transcriptional regulator
VSVALDSGGADRPTRATDLFIVNSNPVMNLPRMLARYGLAASSMHKILIALDSRGLIREEEELGSIRYRLEDPFFARWLRLVQSGS